MDTSNESLKPIDLICCYASDDKGELEKLLNHLKSLADTKQIRIWSDQLIEPGTDKVKSINEHLDSAHIILLLISSSFLTNNDDELKHALERKVPILPIILRPVYLASSPIGNLKVLPENGKPISTYPNADEAWVEVTKAVDKAAEKLRDSVANIKAAEKLRDSVANINEVNTDKKNEDRASVNVTNKHHIFSYSIYLLFLPILIIFISTIFFASQSPIFRSSPSNSPSPTSVTVNPLNLYHHIIDTILPSWSDPLDGTQQSGGWGMHQGLQTGCDFSDHYQAYANVNGEVDPCFASQVHVTDFAYEINMTMLQGNTGGGGLIFRAASASDNSAMYRFDVQPAKQTYDILVQANNSSRINLACGPNNQEHCFNTNIHQSSTNLLTVIGIGSKLYFYVNAVFLTEVINARFSSGLIGVFAANNGQKTVVKFDSVRLWYLRATG